MDEKEVLFKEYEAVRQEIITSLSNRITILSVGLTATGVLITIALAFAESRPTVCTFIFIIGIPSICIFFLQIWFGEYRRAQNAGRHIYKLEEKINKIVDKGKLLTFETETREKRKFIFDPTVILISIVSLISLVIGLFLWKGSLLLKMLVGYNIVLIIVGFSIWKICVINKFRKRT